MKRLRTFWPALVLALLALIPFWRCTFFGENIGAWDEVRQMAPWSDTTHGSNWDVLQADSVLQFYGWRDQVFKAWGSGHMPLWNHRELAGTPLLANSQSGGLYPPHIVLGWLHIPTSPAMAFLAWLHVFLAALGVYTLGRGLGGGKVPAFLGAVGFGLSPFMIGWSTLPSVIETVAWIPWLLVGIYHLPHRRGVFLLAFSAAMLLLAGHLQFAAYGLIAGMVAYLVRLIQDRKLWRPLLMTGLVGFSAGSLLAAPQVLPVLNFGKLSHRRVEPTSDGFAAYSAGAVPLWQLLSVPDSNLLGLPTSSIELKGTTVNGFWPDLVQRGGNFAESAIAVGPVVLWLLIMGFRKRSTNLGIAIVGLVGLLLAVGTLLGAALYYFVPGWSATGSPGRAGVLFVLAACTLCGTWNPSIEPLSAKAIRDRTLLFAAIIVLCAGLIFRLPLTPWIPSLTTDDLHAAIPQSLLAGRTLGVAALVAGLGFLLAARPKFTYYAAGGLAVVAAVLPGALLVRSSTERLSDVSVTSARIAFVNGGWDLLTSPKAVMPPNTAGILRLHELGGYDSIIDKATRDQLADIDGEDPAPAANGNMMFIKPNFDATKLADAGVTEVWSTKPLAQLGQPPNPENGIYKYFLPGQGRTYMDSGPATLTHENPESIEIEATGPGILTLKDNLRDGWTVSVDEQPETLMHNPWPQVQVPKGRHTVRYQYSPPGLVAGFYALAAGLALLAVYTAFTRRKLASNGPAVVQ